MIKTPYKTGIRIFWIFIISFSLLGLAGCAGGGKKQPADFVDPLIGTTLDGNVTPNVGVPFGMTQWTPQTTPPENKGVPPYRYYDPMIQGFRGSHWLSGGATQDYGNFTIMPITGTLHISPQERASSYYHDDESSSPYYYQTRLRDYDILAEVTATSRTGFLRFTFPASDSSYIIIDSNAAYEPTRDDTKGDGYVKILPDQKEIVGYNPVYRMYQGWGQPAGFSGYFVMRFNKAFDSFGTWDEGQAPKLNSTEAQDRPGAFVQFNTSNREVVNVKVGTSFTSIENARNNLDQEIPSWNFTRVMQTVRKKWNNSLGVVDVQGGTPVQRRIFYSALYHAMQLPRMISDVDGSYVAFGSDHEIANAGDHTEYGDYSLWDTYRAVYPLLTLLDPSRVGDMMNSLVDKGNQGGFLPIFPAWNNYTSEMIGDHAISVITDAYQKGIHNFDVDEAYRLMKKNATELPTSKDEYVAGKGRRALDTYLKFGYIPLEDSVKAAFHQGEQVSRTLEYAYDDWALAHMAGALGHQNDYKSFMERSSNFEHVFDPDTGFVRGRYEDGSWVKPFDPAVHYSYITEGTSWQYSWYVPQNIPRLIELMGGRETFIRKLDTFFKEANRFHPSFRDNAHYWHGNEPDQLAPYLFACAGESWKTQKWVREIMNRSYQDNPGGLPGNDDSGQMSAWYVFSAMGFYPVCPGSPVYVIGSPLFDSITIKTTSGKPFEIVAKNNSRKNKYIQSAVLNGQPLEKPLLTHQEISKGGILILSMGPKPNKKWGNVIISFDDYAGN